MTFSLSRLRLKKHFAAPVEMPMDTDTQLPPEGLPLPTVVRETPPPLPIPVPVLQREEFPLPAPCRRPPGKRTVTYRKEHSRMQVVRLHFPEGTQRHYLRFAAYQLCADLERLSGDERWAIEPEIYVYDSAKPMIGVSISCSDGPTLIDDMDRAVRLMRAVLQGEAR